MKLNKMLTALAVLSVLPLSSCGGTSSTSTPNNPTSTGGGSTTVTTIPVTDYKPDLSNNVTMNMSVMYQKANTRMKFGGTSVSFPYKAANGKSYNSGDWKPVWEQVQSDLNITINDVTDTASEDIKSAFQIYQTSGFSGIDIAQGSSSEIIAEGTTKNTILKLNDYFDKLPNFAKFLNENPIVHTNIKDGNGNIYYAPYFDGNDDIERMLMVRQDWVVKLLDEENPSLDTTTTVSTAYEAFMPSSFDKDIEAVSTDGKSKITINKKYGEGQGIIARQNALTTKNGASLVKELRDYIDATYPAGTFEKRSDLFCGQNAVYDADELVALFRCVKANPNYLTGNASNILVPFFPREARNDRTADLWRFAGQIFGVRGLESRSGYLYVDEDGKINDARDDVETREALKRLNNMYKEGLILNNFTSTATTNETAYRTYLLENNIGFSTYDYNQTTTIFNNTISNINGFLFTSIIPAVTNMGGEWIHYTESWRSVKSEGWFITSATANDAAKLDRALAIFDFFYSPEGNQLMSYGPDAWIEHDGSGNVVTIEYQGKQVPKLSAAALTELATLAKGNYTNYYRFWLGGTYPIGYVKEQGMEYQTVADAAKPGLARINNAIATGVLHHVSSNVVTNENHIYDMVPTTFALLSSEQNALSNNFTALDEAINNTNKKSNIWSSIVMNGFGATTASGTTPTEDDYIQYVEDLGIQSYVNIYQRAYSRMLA